MTHPTETEHTCDGAFSDHVCPACVEEEVDGPVCGCCGATEEQADLKPILPGWVEGYKLPETMCSDCLAAWYSGGMTNPDEISKKVWAYRTSLS